MAVNIKDALKEQYRASLAMLVDCVEKCPHDLWTDPSRCDQDGDRTCTRSFWRIAFHGVYFTHLYFGQSVDDFKPWPGRRRGYFEGMWQAPWETEPFEFTENAEPITKRELLDYIAYVDSILDETIDGLDLESSQSGIPWYKDFPKLSHELLTLRHLQGHVGQLSEILMAREIDTDWISRTASHARA